MNTTAQAAISHYLGKGLTLDQAVAAVAVFMVESGLNPQSENNTGTETGGAINPNGSYGLMQLNGPRQKDLLDFAAKKGLTPADLNTQLDFFLTDAANHYPKTWAVMQKPLPGSPAMHYSDIIPIIVEDYERPANPAAEIDKAMAYANAFIGYPILPAPAPILPPKPTAPSAPTPTLPDELASITIDDPELVAIATIWGLLSQFDKPSAGRMLAYFHDRLGV